MKSTPTGADWGKFTRWKHRFKKEGIIIPTEGNIIESIEKMEREHPELTSIPDKALEMKRASQGERIHSTVKEKINKVEDVSEEEVEEEEKTEEEEIPEEKELFTERPINKVDIQTQERDITVVLRLKLRVKVEVEE